MIKRTNNIVLLASSSIFVQLFDLACVNDFIVQDMHDLFKYRRYRGSIYGVNMKSGKEFSCEVEYVWLPHNVGIEIVRKE